MRLRKRVGLLLACGLVLVLCGCGQKKGTVSGKVILEGKTVQFGSVLIVGRDHVPHSGAIQPDGTYVVQEVPYGEASLAVISTDPASRRAIKVPRSSLAEGEPPPEPPPVDNQGWFPIPDKYSDENQSGLSLTVQQPRTTHNIELKDEPNPPEPDR
jgi:hypothetical protein